MWELIVIGLTISPVLLPAPSAIAVKFSSSLDILWIDFVQTLVKGACLDTSWAAVLLFLRLFASTNLIFLSEAFCRWAISYPHYRLWEWHQFL